MALTEEQREIALRVAKLFKVNGHVWITENQIVDFIERFIAAMPKPEEFEIDWPEYHDEAMGCGLEDRNISDRYEAMRHGWECAIERVAGRLPETFYTEAPIAPPASDYDLSAVIHLTHNKTKSIVERGYKITGFVLTDDTGRKCICDMSAVRWFDDPINFQRMMHPDSAQPASEQKPDENDAPFYDVEDEARSLCDELLTCGMDRWAMQRALSKAYEAGNTAHQPEYKAQRDAERYRWLRDHSKSWSWNPTQYKKEIISGFAAFNTGYLGFEFESAIDAAIASVKGGA